MKRCPSPGRTARGRGSRSAGRGRRPGGSSASCARCTSCSSTRVSRSSSNRQSSTRSACSEKSEKFVPSPSHVAPSGNGFPARPPSARERSARRPGRLGGRDGCRARGRILCVLRRLAASALVAGLALTGAACGASMQGAVERAPAASQQPVSLTAAIPGVHAGPGPFVPTGTLNSGSTSGHWGDGGTARTGALLGCFSGRHYSVRGHGPQSFR